MNQLLNHQFLVDFLKICTTYNNSTLSLRKHWNFIFLKKGVRNSTMLSTTIKQICFYLPIEDSFQWVVMLRIELVWYKQALIKQYFLSKTESTRGKSSRNQTLEVDQKFMSSWKYFDISSFFAAYNAILFHSITKSQEKVRLII